MSKFTVLDFEGVDEKIQKDLDIITKRLCKEFEGNVESVVLCGGFGRGEGSVIFDNGGMRPYNDYDLLVVTKRRVSGKRLDKISKELAEEVGIRFVDLGAVTRKVLKKMGSSVFVRDFKSSQVVWGEDVLVEIPDVDATSIDLEEARIQLRNRLICFFELTPSAFFSGGEIKPYDHRRFVLQISKAVIAVSIGQLIERGKYSTSYRQQRSEHKVLFGHSDLVAQAYGVKLGVLDPVEVEYESFWKEACTLFVERYEVIMNDNPFKKTSLTFVNRVKNLIKRFLYGERVVPEHVLRRVERIVVLVLKEQNREAARLAQMWFGKNVDATDAYGLCVLCDQLWSKYHH